MAFIALRYLSTYLIVTTAKLKICDSTGYVYRYYTGGLRHFAKEGIVSNTHFWLMIYIPNHERQTFSIPFVVEKCLI